MWTIDQASSTKKVTIYVNSERLAYKIESFKASVRTEGGIWKRNQNVFRVLYYGREIGVWYSLEEAQKEAAKIW